MLPVRLAMLGRLRRLCLERGRRRQGLKTDLFFNIFDHFAFTEGESAGRYDGLIELLEKTLACAPWAGTRAGKNRPDRRTCPARRLGHPAHAARPPHFADDSANPARVSGGGGVRCALRVLSGADRGAARAAGGAQRLFAARVAGKAENGRAGQPAVRAHAQGKREQYVLPLVHCRAGGGRLPA